MTPRMKVFFIFLCAWLAEHLPLKWIYGYNLLLKSWSTMRNKDQVSSNVPRIFFFSATQMGQ